MTCIEVGESTVTATFSGGPGAAERKKKDFQMLMNIRKSSETKPETKNRL